MTLAVGPGVVVDAAEVELFKSKIAIPVFASGTIILLILGSTATSEEKKRALLSIFSYVVGAIITVVIEAVSPSDGKILIYILNPYDSGG